jgi:hypothetical protein
VLALLLRRDRQRREPSRARAPGREGQLRLAIAVGGGADHRGDGRSRASGDRQLETIRKTLRLENIIELFERLLRVRRQFLVNLGRCELARDFRAKRPVGEQAVERRALHEPQVAVASVVSAKADQTDGAPQRDRKDVRGAVRLHDFKNEFEVFRAANAETETGSLFPASPSPLGTTASFPFHSHGQDALSCSLISVSGGSEKTASTANPASTSRMARAESNEDALGIL